MERIPQILLTLIACLWAAVAPLTAGKVICKTACGHQAIEPLHQPGSCPVDSHDEHGGEGEQEEPCTDTVLSGDVASGGVKQSAPSIDYAKEVIAFAPLWQAVKALTLPSAASNTYTHSPPSKAADNLRLSTVVLLI